MGSISYINTRSDTNHISDPTANRAVKLADIKRNRVLDYNYYSSLHETITAFMQQLDNEGIMVIKAYIGIRRGGIAGISKEIELSIMKTKRKAKRLIIELEKSFNIINKSNKG